VIPILHQDTALVIVAKLAAVSSLLSCLEIMTIPAQLRDCGLMSWAVARLRRRWLACGPLATGLNFALAYPNIWILLILRALLASAILLGPHSAAWNPWLLCLSAVVFWLTVVRSNYGLDGADQMTWIIVAALALVSLVPTPFVKGVCLWFLALQVCLSYGTAGLAKAVSRGWRDGSFLAAILGTQIYGHPTLANLLRTRRLWARVLANQIIIWECAFPLVLVVPGPVAAVFLASGALFHLANAYLMGLNTFLWSFVATYPAVMWCVQTRGW
jgi:hypothetical protein